jgi:mono/diheme cytochrome c family protein
MNPGPVMPSFSPPALALARAAACAVAGLIVANAHADAPLRVPMLPAYQQECGSCHLAYPPGLLPAASWQRLLGGLERHFGSDASLDAATVRELSQWLGVHAGSYRKVQREGAPPPEDRITRANWFVREHREVPADAWKRPSIRSAAQCAACHTRAEQGDFDEHAVRIPR